MGSDCASLRQSGPGKAAKCRKFRNAIIEGDNDGNHKLWAAAATPIASVCDVAGSLSVYESDLASFSLKVHNFSRCPAIVASVVEWSSKPSRVGDLFGTWADDLAAAFVQLEPRKIADQPFRGRIARTDCDPVNVSRVTASKHTVLRLPSHIARSSDDLSFVNLQLRGIGRYAQRGHEQICGPGDLAVVDTTEPFEIANRQDFELFCFAIPRKLLPHSFLERPRLTIATTEVGRALSRALNGYAELCLTPHVPDTLLSASGAHIVDLICHAACVIEDEPAGRLNAPVLMTMMLDHIEHHSNQADLSAATLARTFRCSERYVHKLFASAGRSVGEHVNERRIAACARNLLVQPKLTIAEIAFAAGFRDISHFNRLFKRINGTSPREFRRVGLSNATTCAPGPGF